MVLEMHPQRWGNPALAGPLSDQARALVDGVFGVGDPVQATPAAPPPSGLSPELLDELRGLIGGEAVLVDDGTRALRTRGKSTPDLLRARAGDLSDAPDAVVRPASHEEVVALLAWAAKQRVAVTPFGGGTCVSGGLVAAREGFAGVVSLDLVRMNQLLKVDRESLTATFQPGVRGPEAEALLAEHGLTLGHFPQSFEFASIGGFAATRSSGQSSCGNGRFDQMVVGMRVATPIGDIAPGTAPANAAGPDLRQVFLGSEGALGVITEITVKVHPRLADPVYEAWSFASFADGANAIRELVQRDLRPTVLRLSDEAETLVNLANHAGATPDAIEGCLMIVGYESASSLLRRIDITTALTDLGGTFLPGDRGADWAAGRYSAPYQRDSMLDAGVLVETLETATFWSNRDALYRAVKGALESSLGSGAVVLCHISHVYEAGCSLYFTVAAKADPDAISQWWAAKRAASDAMIAMGSTITHHHAVGTDHKPWLAEEIGPVGVAILRGLKATIDPTGVLNPGVLIP
jgi:alkyldihydroxyacetonephosphate synthase